MTEFFFQRLAQLAGEDISQQLKFEFRRALIYISPKCPPPQRTIDSARQVNEENASLVLWVCPTQLPDCPVDLEALLQAAQRATDKDCQDFSHIALVSLNSAPVINAPLSIPQLTVTEP